MNYGGAHTPVSIIAIIVEVWVMENQKASISGAFSISNDDQAYINVMRGISIIRVVLVHLGLSWFYPPYSQYVGIFLPVLFFVSGAVSYYSCSKSLSAIEYLIKRLLPITIPFYVFGVMIIAITVLFYPGYIEGPGQLVGWLFIWPKQSTVFFPFGQIWFINSLALIVLITSPIFFWSRRWPGILWVALSIPVLLSAANFFTPLYESFVEIEWLGEMRYSHQLWQSLVLAGVFSLGAIHYRFFSEMKTVVAGVVALSFLLLSAALYFVFSLDFELHNHVRNRSIYYLSLSVFAIYLFLFLKPLVNWILANVSFLRWFILYANKYAYSIFILHTLVLYYIENWFGLSDLGEKPMLALFRMGLVMLFTFILAKPLGEVSRTLAHFVRGKVLILMGTSPDAKKTAV